MGGGCFGEENTALMRTSRALRGGQCLGAVWLVKLKLYARRHHVNRWLVTRRGTGWSVGERRLQV